MCHAHLAIGAVVDLTAKTSPFSFGGGQTVKGYGTINIGSGKTINLAGGGTWAPGGSIGTLSVTGNLDLTGGTAAIELGTPGTSHASAGLSDGTAVSGNLTLGGTLNLIDNAGAGGSGSAGVGSYKLFTYSGSESGSFASITGWGASSKHIAVVNVPADLAVYLDSYDYATANTLATPINFGSIHAGGSFGTQPFNDLACRNKAAPSFRKRLCKRLRIKRPPSVQHFDDGIRFGHASASAVRSQGKCWSTQLGGQSLRDYY
ncbi:MAG: hypothetical protein WBL72_22205 [Thermoguttaceae bacterium]